MQKPESERELAGKVAIVTGASRGIGKAVAAKFARNGACVVLTGRNAEAGTATAKEIGGGDVIFVKADQGSDADWAAVLAHTQEAFGRVDILVANAGVSNNVPTARMELAQFRDLNRINLRGPFLGLKHCVAAMRRHGEGGSVVLMSSIVGKVGVPGYIHYSAAKGGLRLMAKAAALELGAEKIRVNSIHPGMIRTDMTAAFDEQSMVSRIPLGKFGEPDDIANAALFLASERGKFVTGIELVADGGVDGAMTGKLAKRTIIVTGATKGIGREACLALAREGANVVVTGRDEKGGLETAALVNDLGAKSLYLRHDIRSEEDWRNVFAKTTDRFGAPQGLVNNAGIFFVKPLADTTEEDFDDIYSINVEGTFLGVKHAFQSFAVSKTSGAIVNVSSLMGQVGFPNAIAYCATKGAITAMTKTAAMEGAAMTPKVRVNSLHPGVIWTPMITGTFGDDKALSDAFADDTPLKMIGLPEYMADAITFLISDDSAYVTGAELTADGGRGAD